MAEIVPHRLFFSVLPSGEREFSCLVRLPDDADDVIRWSLRGNEGAAGFAGSGRCPMTK
jgi:hypothetical protein